MGLQRARKQEVRISGCRFKSVYHYTEVDEVSAFMEHILVLQGTHQSYVCMCVCVCAVFTYIYIYMHMHTHKHTSITINIYKSSTGYLKNGHQKQNAILCKILRKMNGSKNHADF